MLDKFASLAALKPAKKRAAAAGAGANGDAGSGVVNLMRNPVRSATACLPDGAEQLAAMLEARALENEYGQHLSARKWFSEAIGHAAPDREIDAAILNLLSPGACEGACDPSRRLFLDTETTGLTGGTGTYPFMVGIAWWDAGGLEVEQFFMRDHSEEHALLVTLAERIAERGVLVTFNGKSFDWPLLETRYRMTRKIKVPALQAHLDFLHPARNLWRIRLGSVRLAELEKHVLGFHRGADIIGAMIPQFYFDYLRGGAVEPIVEIFKHNQTDFARARRACEPDSRRAGGAGKIREATRWSFSVCPGFASAEARRSVRRNITRSPSKAIICRPRRIDSHGERWRGWRSAMAILSRRARCGKAGRETSREGFEAYEQLAIYHEHLAEAPRKAAELAKEALVELRRSRGVMSPALHRQYKERFEHRLARLERKSAKTLLDADGVDARA